MKRIKSFLILAACTLSAHSAPLMLVTSQEMTASNNALAPLTAKIAPEKDAPKIEVTAPNLTQPLASPTAIWINFQASAPATIKPETFKVLYGVFQIDITDRLTAVAKATSHGISVQEASLPVGKHKLLLSVEDSIGRKGYRLIEFEIN